MIRRAGERLSRAEVPNLSFSDDAALRPAGRCTVDMPHPRQRVVRSERFVRGVAAALYGAVLHLAFAGFVAGGSALAAPGGGDDTDLDGLSDGLETYLTQVSSSSVWDVSPFNGDTDGDSQPDGFEFCLSGRLAPMSPGVIHPVEPRMTLGSYQSGSDIVVSLFVIPGALSLVEDFGLFVAVRSPGQPPQLVDLTSQIANAVTDVGFVWWGPHQMAVLTLRIPVDFIRLYESVALAAVGRLDNLPLGDTLSLGYHAGRVYRWTYFQQKAGGDTIAAVGFAEPQDGYVDSDWTQDQVCGSVDLQVPTGTPGVLQSVAASIGCTSGSFACNGGICSDGGAADVPKLVLDVDLLLGL
jgi:hypothetical protein